MTGIERLRALAGAWDEWGLGGTLAEMADEIDRELREAMGGEEHEPAADVSMSAYDLLPNEERDAIAWVRSHGGLDHVRAEWRSRVPYDRYVRRRQRLLGHIAECETALGRRRRRIEELEGLLKTFTNENAELRRRAMPEGYEWPRYESGASVGFGDDVSRHGEDFEANVIALYRDGSFSLNFWAYSKGERVKRAKRPAVPAADGEPLEVGQTVWDENGDELVIGAIEDGGHTVTCQYVDIGDSIPTHGMWSPSDLTHQHHVLDADGVPIKKGDTVYLLPGEWCDKFPCHGFHGGEELEVFADGEAGHVPGSVQCREREKTLGRYGTCYPQPSQLTHTKPEHPDSWQRIEEDARLKPFGYVDRVLGWDMSKSHSQNQARSAMTHDLVRRCRALAERERGE